jgi:DNA-binding CsgD family transcriptional regulator
VFGAAKRAAIVGWLRGIVAHNPANPYPLDFSEWIEVEEPSDEPEGLSDEAKRELERLFRAARKQQQGRAVAAAKRDVLICDLLVRGYRNRGIAHALGLSIKSVEKYRKHIRAILQAAASQQQAA